MAGSSPSSPRLPDITNFDQPLCRDPNRCSRIAFLIGEKDIVVAVFVDVHESQTVVLAFSVDDGCAVRQREGQFHPPFIRPVKDRLFLVVADNQFAAAIAVQIAQPHTAVASSCTCKNLVPLHFQTVKK